jgi:hypothetical protein
MSLSFLKKGHHQLLKSHQPIPEEASPPIIHPPGIVRLIQTETRRVKVRLRRKTPSHLRDAVSGPGVHVPPALDI